MIVQCYFILKVSNKILLIHLITTSDATLGSALTLLLKQMHQWTTAHYLSIW